MGWLPSHCIVFFIGVILTLLMVEYVSIMTSGPDTMTSPPVRSHSTFFSYPLSKSRPRLAYISPQPKQALQRSPPHNKQMRAKDLIDNKDLTSPSPVTSASPSTAKYFQPNDSFLSFTTSNATHSNTVLNRGTAHPMISSVSCNTSVLPHDGRGYQRRIPQAIVIGVMKGGTGTL